MSMAFEITFSGARLSRLERYRIFLLIRQRRPLYAAPIVFYPTHNGRSTSSMLSLLASVARSLFGYKGRPGIEARGGVRYITFRFSPEAVDDLFLFLVLSSCFPRQR